MQKPVIFLAALVLVLAACGKNKYNTKPYIALKSVSSTSVPPGGQLQIVLEFTDKEGDISDSIFVEKLRINEIPSPVHPVNTFGFPVPAYSKKQEGEVVVTLDYSLHLTGALNPPTQGNPPVAVPDTMVYKFSLRDLGGNISDTVEVGPIEIIR